MLTIDGSIGEGGGQILRSALALAVCQRRAFRIVNIRARRSRPGLRPQHLAAVRAAAGISAARVDGATPGSRELSFFPSAVEPGRYRFATGTAGSVTLVLQTVLPALLTASGPSELYLEGGTHNPRAPTFEFLAKAYLPLIERMGPKVVVTLERAGFYPAGGGRMRIRLTPVRRFEPLRLCSRGALIALSAEILLSKLPGHIAEREARVLTAGLDVDADSIALRVAHDSPGPGNVVSVFAAFEELTEVFAAFGQRGTPAERVAATVVAATERYLAAGAPVGPLLADQLLVPLALAGGGSFVTVRPSRHTTTNLDVIRQFLALDIRCIQTSDPRQWKIEVGAG